MADETHGRGTGVYANFMTESGTRCGTRALGPFRQAVLVLRWFADNTRNTTAGTSRCSPMPTDSRSGCPASGLAAKHDTTCARKAEGLLGALAPWMPSIRSRP